MIDKTSWLHQALAGLRAQPVVRAEATAPTQHGPRTQGANASALRHAALQRRLNQCIAQIDPDDPNRRHRAVRAIVMISLIREFGDELERDPAFQTLVDQVSLTMHDEPRLHDSIDLALKELRDISWPVRP